MGVHIVRAANCTNGLYLSPKMGVSVDSLQPLSITWDPSCLPSTPELDIYLYAPNSASPRIHVWQGVSLSRNSYTATLFPRWWNSTSSVNLQLIIVSSGDPPFMSTFPAGPVFTATYAPPNGGIPLVADTSQIDSGITPVNDLANQKHRTISAKAAAGVLVPLLFIVIGIVLYIKFKRSKSILKRRAWTEKLDQRMSTISTDWKSVSAAGATAAIRNSMAVGSRNSSFSFGALRPLSTAAVEGEDIQEKNSHIRTGTGVGLRNPNALSRSSEHPSSVRVSRVSFADQARPSTESRRTRAFHSAYVPPVPALPKSSDDVVDPQPFSPLQTAGALSLTQEDIRARVASNANGTNAKNNGSLGGDELLPALSSMSSPCLLFHYSGLTLVKKVMRTGINQGQPDDYLLPTSPSTLSPPSPTHPKSLSKSHSTTLSITTSFPTPPSTYPSRFSTTPIQQPLPASVLSPDEMLRAYAARKKSLADAASAGIRLSGSGSSSSVGVSPMTNPASPGAQTVSSIHATGMRVAYHTNVTTPLGDSASGSQNTNNPFVSSSLHISTPSSSDRAQYAIGDVEEDEEHYHHQQQPQPLEDAVDEYDYAYAYAYDTPQQVEGEGEVDVGFAGRGAFGYHHQNQHLA